MTTDRHVRNSGTGTEFREGVKVGAQGLGNSEPVPELPGERLFLAASLAALVLLAVIYWRPGREMYRVWVMAGSYYTHGFLVPLISLYFIWKDRQALLAEERKPSASGFLFLGSGVGLLLLGDFLGFRVFSELSLLPVLTGVSLVFLGKRQTARMWFPIGFLVFMIPIPPSLTQSITLQLKLVAAQCAVVMANALTLPMIRDGSTIFFRNDQLLIGEVCGGLRSLIALIAFGSLFAYMSKTRPWARVLLLVLAGPIAIVANVLRIFFLCVVGYFWGSRFASGTVHDVSGIMIFVVAFAIFFYVETRLRRLAPAAAGPEEAAS